MDRPLHILILEDNASDAELVRRELRKAGLDVVVQVVLNRETYLQALDAFGPDVILADYSLPGFDGLTALILARQRLAEVPVVVVSGAIGEETAIEALKAGATDYVLKQRLSRLGPVVKRALLEARQLAEKRRAEESLRSVAQFLDENPYPVLRIDREGTILYTNRSSVALYGEWQCNAGRPAPEPFARLVREALDRGQGCQMDVESGGRVFSFVFVPIADGGYVNLYGRDITERKQAEEELEAAKESAERAKAAAEQANRAKDHFLAVLSHELRTPLTPVVMGVSMLQGRPDLDPQVRETLEMVRRNVEMEARLIDDLLDVTRIARGKIELNRRPVELCTVIQRAVEVCTSDIEARRLHFGVDLGPAAPYWVEADVPRLQQVFWNLLKNAIKFTPHDGCVGIRCRPEEGSGARGQRKGFGVQDFTRSPPRNPKP